MTKQIKVGDRVEAGSGDDHDTGRVIRFLAERVGECDVEVAWDSGVRTPAVSSDLRRI